MGMLVGDCSFFLSFFSLAEAGRKFSFSGRETWWKNGLQRSNILVSCLGPSIQIQYY